MTDVILSVTCTVIGTIIGAFTLYNQFKKDTKSDGEKDGEIKNQLNYIGKGVDDIRLDIRAQDRKIDDISERVIRVEESTKSAHHRIDSLEK
jgi:peptidoglycan hydrolase CwlO-like protein